MITFRSEKPTEREVRETHWIRWIMIVLILIAVTGIGGLYYTYTHSLYAARNWGGSITLTVPQGGEHISTAWKGNELWTETYFPAENKCVYQQQSQYGLVEGTINIQPCNYRSSK